MKIKYLKTYYQTYYCNRCNILLIFAKLFFNEIDLHCLNNQSIFDIPCKISVIK